MFSQDGSALRMLQELDELNAEEKSTQWNIYKKFTMDEHYCLTMQPGYHDDSDNDEDE